MPRRTATSLANSINRSRTFSELTVNDATLVPGHGSKLPDLPYGLVQTLAALVPHVTEDMHKAFCAVFHVRADRAKFVEWTYPTMQDRFLTLGQWWRKVMSLKMESQWRSSITRFAKESNSEELLQLQGFLDLESSENQRWDILLFILSNLIDKTTFESTFASPF